MQVENEYGSFDKDKDYLRWQLGALRHAGFKDVYFFTADGDVQLPNGTLPELPAVVNFGPGEADSAFARLARFKPGEPLMSGEYWAGWFDQWGRPHNTTNAARQTKELRWMLDTRLFGEPVHVPRRHDARIHERREHRRRALPPADVELRLRRGTRRVGAADAQVLHVPRCDREGHGGDPAAGARDAGADGRARVLTRTRWHRSATTCPPPVHVERPRGMETFGQSYGYILYHTRIADAARGELVIRDVRDYAQIYVNGELKGTLDRRLAEDSLPLAVPAGATLDILVENSGRVNFAKPLRHEEKGITHSVTLAGRELTGWDVYTRPMRGEPGRAIPPDFASPVRGPDGAHPDIVTLGPGLNGAAFYSGAFTLDSARDTFLDTRGWGKGTVWVNGHQLGRFWGIGPEQTLYVPGPWLRKGRNDVFVFDLITPEHLTLQGLDHPILDELRPNDRSH